MASSYEEAVRHARSAGSRLNERLSDSPTIVELIKLVELYRVAYHAAIFADFPRAAEQKLEDQLWFAHSKVNAHYRKQLSKLRKHTDGKPRAVVEVRKFAKHYLEFIKSSQRFYRLYILHLDERYGGIIELRQVAHKWKQSGPRQLPDNAISSDLKRKLVISCYQSLIHLGDLSRYRETELGGKERNWGPAIGYYGLAAEILPDSGVSHNQQAVVALAEGNHLRATYHLYRSLATKEPHPSAKDNLELEFKKIITAWAKGELIKNSSHRDGSGAGGALVAWFVRLHSKCYKGEDFPEHDELENEVINQLAVELKERSLDGALSKFILVNIAAEYFASVKLQGGNQTPQVFKSYFFFLRLNVKTFFTLLQTFQPELERLAGHDVRPETSSRPAQLSDKITAIARRTLPGLRLYSSWLSTNWALLAADVADTVSQVQIRELWKAYADTLTLLATTFLAEDLPTADYMLEEDADTVGFMPLMSESTKRIWYSGHVLKRKWSDDGVERHHPNVEMLVRVRDFLVDGLQLAMNEKVPIVLDGIRFIYQEAGVPSELLTGLNPENEHEHSPAAAVELNDVAMEQSVPTIPDDQVSHGLAPSESASTTTNREAAMNRMVDDLVGPDDGLDPLPEEDENIPPTPPEQTFDDTALVNDSTYGLGPMSASDFVQMVQNYSPPAYAPKFAPNADRKAASPSVWRELASLPSLDQSGIWNSNYGSSGPSSPFLPPGLHIRGSPLSAGSRSQGHSRVASANSVKSSQPYGDSWSYYSVTPAAGYAQDYHTGNAFDGNVLAGGWEAHNHPVCGHGHAPSGDFGMASPFLFGVGGGPWSTEPNRTYSSMGRTPPNGQVG